VYVAALAVGAVLELLLVFAGIQDGSSWLDVLMILAPAGALFGFRHPTFVLPMYFFIGTLKNLPVFQSFPGNLSVFMGLYIGLCCVGHLLWTRRHSIFVPAMVTFSMIVALIVVAYARSVMPTIAQTKMMYLATFLMMSFIAPQLLMKDRRGVEELLWGLITVGLIVLGGMLLGTARDTYIHERMGMSGSSAITTANALVLLATLSFFWWLPRTRRLFAKIAVVGIGLGALAGLAATGSRGPFFFGFVTLGVGCLFHARSLTRNLATNALRLALVAICVYGVAWGLRESRYTEEFGGTERTMTIVTEDWQSVVRSDDRYWLMKTAVDMIRDKPLLGHGLGAYNRQLSLGDTWDYYYPHNLVLDLGCEAGLPAAVLLVVLYLLAFTGLGWPLLSRPPGGWLGRAMLAVFLTLLFAFLEAMVSNDVFKARYEWGALGLACAMAVVARRTRPPPTEDGGGLPG
jgi:O-antigen ligase